MRANACGSASRERTSSRASIRSSNKGILFGTVLLGVEPIMSERAVHSYRPNGLSSGSRSPMPIRRGGENGRVCSRSWSCVVALVVGGVVASVAAASGSGAAMPLGPRLARALAVPGLGGSTSAAVAVDLTSGEVLFKRHQFAPLEPASNEKLAVTLAALKTLGSTFRIRTEVFGDGGQIGNVWRGNLVLRGHGDPTLSSHDLKRVAWLVRGAGIRKVTGSVVGDESFFDAKRGVWGWKREFYGTESPPLSALSVDRGLYQNHVSPRPALAAAALFRRQLINAGVSVAGRSTQGRVSRAAVPLAYVESPPLWKILRFMGVWSDNFTAELVLKQLGATQGNGTSARGAAVVREVLAENEVPLGGVRIVDGSGLSQRDRLTVGALVAILRIAAGDPVMRKPFQAALAVAGKTGTLRHRLAAARTKGHVLAKTGTTRAASALAGYVNGRYAFAILHNGHPLASWYAK